jgi:hypothetical protein
MSTYLSPVKFNTRRQKWPYTARRRVIKKIQPNDIRCTDQYILLYPVQNTNKGITGIKVKHHRTNQLH